MVTEVLLGGATTHTCVVSAGQTSVVSAAKTSVVSADKRSAVCQDIPSSLPTQGRPRSGRPCVRNAQGMSWQTADLVSADTTDVLAADTTDVLPADTTHVLPADNPGFLWKTQKSCGRIRKAATQILGFGREKSGIFQWEAGFYYEIWGYYAGLDIGMV